MAINKRLLVKPPSTGITPSEHFGVALYEGDGTTSHSINGGKFGAAGYFNGTSSYIDTGIKNTVGARTLSVWIYYTGAPSSTETIIGGVSSGSAGYTIRLETTILKFQQQGEASVPSTSLSNLNTNAWNHIVGVIDGSTSTLYLNGSSVGTGTVTDAGSHNLYVGAGNDVGTANQFFKGKIDQVRIFDKALSSSEVSTLYAETVETVTDVTPLGDNDGVSIGTLQGAYNTYRFEDNVNDENNNTNGTAYNITYDSNGKFGKAASFNGSTSYIDLGTVSRASSMTLSAWVKTTGNSLPVVFLDNGAVFRINIISSGVVAAGNLAGTDLLGSTPVNDNNWHHLLAVFNDASGNKLLYVDGTLENSQSYTSGSRTYKDGIGIDNNNPASAAILIDQVRIFKTALTPGQVKAIYTENSLTASYRFEGNANDDMNIADGTASNVTYEYGLNFTPDFVWIKARNITYDGNITDSTRGTTKQVYTTGIGAEQTNSTFVTSFDTGGFTVGNNAYVNNNTNTYVAWCLKAKGGTTSSNTNGTITSTVQVNDTAGFSIVKYTGNGSASQTVGHGLSATPEMIMVKNLATNSNWAVYHTATGISNVLFLNATNAATSVTNKWAGTNSTVFGVNTAGDVNQSGVQLVAYAFHSVEGFSKIGSYTGTGAAGNIVETGFEPAFLMIKRTDTAQNWPIEYVGANGELRANLNNAETSTRGSRFLSNGFELTVDWATRNASGGTYIYMAFAADPDTEAPTVAKSFSTVAYTGDGTSNRQIDLGFKPGLYWVKARGTSNCAYHNLFDIVRGGDKTLYSNVTSAEVTQQGCGYIQSFDDNGITYTGGSSGLSINNSGENFIAWAWKADDNEPTIFGGPALAVYKFEDNLNDVTGNYNGTDTSITYTSNGKFNKAATFDGSNDSGSLPFNLQGIAFSISFWAKNTLDSTNYYLIANNSGSTQAGWYIGGNGSSGTAYVFRFNNGGTDYFNFTSSAVDDSDWHHVVMTFNNTTNTNGAKIYINGVLDTQATSSSTSNFSFTNSTTLLMKEPGGNLRSDGELDQLRFYNGAMSDIGVAELYAETASQNDDLTLGAPPETIISANANAGFSIVKYEGTGVAGTKVPHGLGQKPDFVVIKHTNDANAWVVFSDATGTFSYSYLNLTNAFTAYSAMSWDSQALNLNSGNDQNGAGDTHIAYFFTSIDGFSKIGSYTGTGTTNSITGLGFQPDWLMIKRATGGSSNGWVICDSVRGVGVNLRADTSGAEANESAYTTSFDSDGFTLAQAGGNTNVSGSTYIYMAFKIN